jgi:hypothetical protein
MKEMDLAIPTSCEENMVEIYNYAKSAGLVNDKDIPELCKPFTRAKLARVMVDYALKLALVEPNLSRRCSFNDVKNFSNEDQFYMALACDFGFLGVSEDGTVQQNFNPNGLVTRAELALTISRFLFGDTLKNPSE